MLKKYIPALRDPGLSFVLEVVSAFAFLFVTVHYLVTF